MCRRSIRTQSEWNVEICGRESARFGGFAAAACRPSSAIARSCISPAALLVNVTARMRSAVVPWRISSAMR